MREGQATEYRGPEGERLYLQLEVAEGTGWVHESMNYSRTDADRLVGVRLLFEQNGVKYQWRLCPEGNRLIEMRQQDWFEPVEQYVVVSEGAIVIVPQP